MFGSCAGSIPVDEKTLSVFETTLSVFVAFATSALVFSKSIT